MAVLTKAEISALSPRERLALVDDLLDSLENSPAETASDQPDLQDWQRRILDERLADLESHPGDDISLDEARNQSLL
jgi:putative addiction module component (TIGR02574 family)